MANDYHRIKDQVGEDRAAIEAFLASKGVTKCPPMLAKGSELKDSRCKEYSARTKQWRKENKK